MNKKPEAGSLVQSNVRMPQGALDSLDEWAEELNREAGWKKFTRSDVIRDVVLEALERRRASKAPEKPKTAAGARR
jgi:metal-responsive CopG/Arc/MetJ family transcriptional regulator